MSADSGDSSHLPLNDAGSGRDGSLAARDSSFDAADSGAEFDARTADGAQLSDASGIPGDSGDDTSIRDGEASSDAQLDASVQRDASLDRADAAGPDGSATSNSDASLPSDAGALQDGGTASAQARYVAPRVVYAGESRRVRVFGSGILAAHGHPVFVDTRPAGTLDSLRDTEGQVTIPPLNEGEHFLRIGSPTATSAARLVAVARTQYPDSQATLPGQPTSLVYDMERRAFFMVYSDRQFLSAPNLARVSFNGRTWSVTQVSLDSPLTVTMTPDGRELLIVARDCKLVRGDPDTLVMSPSEALPFEIGCDAPVIHALADGQVVYGNTSQWSWLYEYPSFKRLDAPTSHSIYSVLSQYQTRMIWARAPTDSTFHAIYNYEVGTRTFEDFFTLRDEYYSSNIALSGDGNRFLHWVDVYDRGLRFLGSLAGLDTAPTITWLTGLSGDGSVASAFDLQSQSLMTYDVRGTGPFVASSVQLPLPFETLGYPTRVILDDGGHTAFVFATKTFPSNPDLFEFRLVVRNLPRVTTTNP